MKFKVNSNIAKWLHLPIENIIGAISRAKVLPDETGLEALYKKASRVGFKGDKVAVAEVVRWHGERVGWGGGGMIDMMLLQCLRWEGEACQGVYGMLRVKGAAELSLVLESCRSVSEAKVILEEAEEKGVALTEPCFTALIKSCGTDTKTAHNIFTSMPAHSLTPSTATYTALMTAYLQAAAFKPIAALYTQCRAAHRDPPADIYLILLQASAAPNGFPLAIAREAFKQATSRGHTHPEIYQAYHSALLHHGDTAGAHALWTDIVRLRKTNNTSTRISDGNKNAATLWSEKKHKGINMPVPQDVWTKDGKTLPRNSLFKSLLELGVWAVVGPIYMMTLFPITVVVQIVKQLLKKKKTVRHRPTEGDRIELRGGIKKHSERKYDVVLFGSTGFTGRLAALYMAKQYKDSDVKWAISGRRADALEEIKKEIGVDVDIIIADTSKPDTLHALVSDTRAIVTTAGPFGLYGTELLKFCANYGTHYCDITGEGDWVREMVDRFDGIAKETGARIVSFCGHDCVPWDIITMACANHLKAKGTDLASVTIMDRVRAGPSGGTLATVFKVLFDTERYEATLKHDPLADDNGVESSSRVLNKNVKVLEYSREEGVWMVPFVMAGVNALCVKRSNALNKYGTRVAYREGSVVPSFFAGVGTLCQMMCMGAVVAFPPLLALARKYVLPKPGEGPSEAAMDAGWLHLSAHAVGEDGTKCTAQMYFKTDAGYRDTARMVVESGLTLALTPADKLPNGPGVMTPGCGCGQPLLDRLIKTGTAFEIQ